jgi:peptidylprolyl isomerase
MMRRALIAFALAACSLAPAFAAPPDPTKWRPLDPENTLYVDTAGGRIVVELYPEIAPRHVERLKDLAREKFYDGLSFHRVIDGFMAQGGDPNGDGTGGSSMPDLPAEFEFRRDMSMPFVEAANRGGERLGFYKALPISTQPDEVMAATRDGRAAAWGLHCDAVASMARASEPNSANSQFFFMLAPRPRLDRQYTIWGRVVWGQPAVERIAKGEPPEKPDQIIAMRVAADLPSAELAPIYVMRSDSPDFRDLIQETRKKRGADFSVCDVKVPVRVPQELLPKNERDRPWWRVIPFL